MRGRRRSSWQVAVLCAALCSMVLFAPAADAAKRVALVIGNDTYDTLPALNNAGADARGMADKLRGLGFDVILKLNASSRDMGRALADFEGQAANAEVGLVFYAGHGIQAGGTNYLVPSDAQIEAEEDLRFEGIEADAFLTAMKNAGTGLNIVIMDACRDNPLPKRTRSAARGLTVTAAPAGIKGTAIVYSAAPGQTAQDGPVGGHGVFTGQLLRVLDRPGLSLEQVFKQTAIQVARATNNKQKPWINSSITGDFIFNASALATAASNDTKMSGSSPEVAFWQSIQNSKQQADFEDYLARFPNGAFASLARRRMEGLAVASLPPPFSVEEMEETYTALKTANVRSGPTTTAAKLGRLAAGIEVEVTGKTDVRGRPWWRVALADGKTGFVWGPLLGPKAAAAPELKTPAKATKPKDLFAIVMPESGLTLGDWVLLAEDRLKDGEFVALLTEAGKLRRAYGRYQELDALLAKAVLGDVRSRSGMQRVTRAALHHQRFGNLPGLQAELNASINKVIKGLDIRTVASARRSLAVLSKLETLAGPGLALLEKRAKAHHQLNEYDEAGAAYRAWIGQAGRDHPKRKKMALGLFKAGRGEALGPQPGATFKDCDDCPEMVIIPPGQFRMGDLSGEGNADENPVHNVHINYSFAVGKFEVTQAQWRAIMGNNPSRFKGDAHPVDRVIWDKAKLFAARLSEKTGKSYRLLSEAEWEYVARAGAQTKYSWGDEIDASKAAYSPNLGSKPVGSYAPNAFGLFDMHGNVWEWTGDCTNTSYDGAPSDGDFWLSGNCDFRILRGGSWDDQPENLRVANRIRLHTNYRNNYYGLRVATTLSQ
jgi:formylglycine-generating enzyme required for sulfatase activity